MSEYGQIIDPYRVAPAQGNIQDYGQFAQRAEVTQAMRVAAALAEATRGFLGQQQGLPQGVDPMAVQQFSGEQQNQQIRGNVDKRAGQDHQSRYDGAKAFNQGYVPTGDDATNPFVQGLRSGGGNPYLLGPLMEFIQGQSGRQGELQTRKDINNDDNTAAQKRLEYELGQRKTADQEKYNLDSTREKQQQQDAFDYVTQFKKTGDESFLAKIDPKLLASPVIYDMIGNVKTELKNNADEVKRKEEAELLRKQIAADKATKDAEVKNNPNGGKSRLRIGLEHTPIGFMASNNAEGKNNFRNFIEDTPAGYLMKWLAETPKAPTKVTPDPALPNWLPEFLKQRYTK